MNIKLCINKNCPRKEQCLYFYEYKSPAQIKECRKYKAKDCKMFRYKNELDKALALYDEEVSK